MPTWYWEKPSFLDGDYFNAVEYFSYVIRSFPDKATLVQQALYWKARALMYLNQMPKAKLEIDYGHPEHQAQKENLPC